MAFDDGTRTILWASRPIKITLASDCNVGDPIGYKSGWMACNSTGDSGTRPVYAEFVAGQDGASGAEITAYREALIDFGTSCAATESDELYISDTGGDYTVNTADTSGRIHSVGFMTSTTQGWVSPSYVGFFSGHIHKTDIAVTAEDWNAFEVRSENTVTTTGEGKAGSFSCRTSSAAGCGTLCGLKVDINRKGTTGNVGTDIRVLHLEAESGSGGTATVTGPVAFIWCKNNMGTGTYSNKFCVIHVTNQGGGKAMDGFLQVNATGNAGVVYSNNGMFDSPQTNAEAGYVKIYINTTEYQIPFYNSA